MTSREVPRVGVGCVVMRAGRALLVKSRRDGRWSTPGGNLDFGESPIECARRETAEETGVEVERLRFLAITNDVMPDRGTHYVTIWVQGEARDDAIRIVDDHEIADAGWFDVASLPEPMHPYFTNLVEGRHLPPDADGPLTLRGRRR
jgi:8-oxo-dGTP diphosphatase